MKKLIIVLFILLFSGCSGVKLIKGRPIKLPVETIQGFPEGVRNCYKDSDLEKIRKELEKQTGMEFKPPYFTYSTKHRGLYYVRYFFPLKKQELYAGAEVWIECGKDTKKIYYLLLPLE